jgi:ABC-2 type transport system ATP-binding protein
MIEVTNLAKNYGEYRAVKGVSFSANPGEVVGFLGPNGAGKTTTIRMLATFLPPSSGTARVAGFDIVKEADDVRKKIGYLPEHPPLYGEMTVLEYLNFVARIKAVPGAQLKNAVESTLERCFISDVKHKLCRHLSRGYRQRVGLAQAIVHNPEVIILDEPTSGLDPKQITEIRQLIRSLGEKHTVILSTHILPEVSMVCGKVVIINSGEVVLESSLADLTKERSLEQVFLECIGSEQQQSAA